MSTTGVSSEDAPIHHLEQFVNARGTRMARDNIGHTYVYHFCRTNSDGSRIEYFRCQHNLACRAMAKLKNGQLIGRVQHSQHSSDCDDPVRRLARRLEREALKKSENLDVMPKTILDSLNNLPPELLDVMSTRAQLHGRMKRRREQIRKRLN